MKVSTKYVAVLVTVIVLGSFYFLASRVYRADMQSLENFVASYDQFDAAISDYSNEISVENNGSNEIDALEGRVDDAFVELNTAAQVRLSSFIKNEKETMTAMSDTSEIAGEELQALSAYAEARHNNSADSHSLLDDYTRLQDTRMNAYIRFQTLGKT